MRSEIALATLRPESHGLEYQQVERALRKINAFVHQFSPFTSTGKQDTHFPVEAQGGKGFSVIPVLIPQRDANSYLVSALTYRIGYDAVETGPLTPKTLGRKSLPQISQIQRQKRPGGGEEYSVKSV